MIDWGLVAKIAGGGFGATLIIMAILAGVVWLIGFVIQKNVRKSDNEDHSGQE